MKKYLVSGWKLTRRSSPSFQYFNSCARLQVIDTALRINLKCNDNEEIIWIWGDPEKHAWRVIFDQWPYMTLSLACGRQGEGDRPVCMRIR
jgi:hypothetical protein